VTGHWIEETTPAQWEHKTAILGFTQVNNAHNGQQLGQALFKICRRIGILHKVWISSFNGPNPFYICVKDWPRHL
jgi:hypothetical protein